MFVTNMLNEGFCACVGGIGIARIKFLYSINKHLIELLN